MDSRPVGVFDSGMGGLTVLHECLVTMPHEDFVYLGDGARLPYGPRPLAEIRGFALEIGRRLEQEGVKLVVVACNSATAAGLHELQRALDVPVVGVLQPEAHAAALTTRNRRVGLLATEATVTSGRYEQLVRSHDAEQQAFIHQAFGKQIEDPLGYDLVLNAEHVGPDEAAAAIVTLLHSKLESHA